MSDLVLDFSPSHYYLSTQYSIELFPEKVTENIKYLKTIDEQHIWTLGNKKEHLKILIANYNPLKNVKQFTKLMDLAFQDQAKIYIY